MTASNRAATMGPGKDPQVLAMAQRAPLLGLIQSHLHATGDYVDGYIRFKGICPICGGEDCFHYHHDNNSWECVSGNAPVLSRGNAFDYLRYALGLADDDAVGWLLENVGLVDPGEVAADSRLPALRGSDEQLAIQGVSGIAAFALESNIVQPEDSGLRFDHSALGNILMKECHVKLLDGNLIVWGDGHYLIGERAVEQAMVCAYRQITTHQRKEVLNYLKLVAPPAVPADARYIAFTNGIYDLETGTLLPPSADLVVPNLIPHAWNPDAQCPELDDALLAWACGREERVTAMLEAAGLCTHRDSEFQAAIFLIGAGANGKSTFLSCVRHAIGEANVMSLDINTMGERFQTAPLVGKLANIGDDISNEFIRGDKLSIFRKIVTGNYVSAEIKMGDTFDFKPYCTLVFSVNEMPRLGDYGDNVFRRIMPIPFEASFQRNAKGTDINLEHALTTEVASERLLYLAVSALGEAKKRGALTVLSDHQEVIDSLKEQSSSVYAFAREELGLGTPQQEDIDCVSTRSLFRRYVDYCKEAACKEVARNQFSRELARLFDMKLGHYNKQRAFRRK